MRALVGLLADEGGLFFLIYFLNGTECGTFPVANLDLVLDN